MMTGYAWEEEITEELKKNEIKHFILSLSPNSQWFYHVKDQIDKISNFNEKL